MKGFLKGLGKIAAIMLASWIGFNLLSDANPVTIAWIIGLIVAFVVNYEIGTIKDRLDSMQWTIDDLKRHQRDDLY